MKLYRISKDKYINDLSGRGAELYGGRWNAEGHAALYCATHLSLSVLELLANQSWKIIQTGYSYIELQLPDKTILHRIDIDDLPKRWRKNPYHNYTVEAGTNWLQKKESVGLLVPSAVLPLEFNILLNPLHADFKNVQLGNSSLLSLDSRLG